MLGKEMVVLNPQTLTSSLASHRGPDGKDLHIHKINYSTQLQWYHAIYTCTYMLTRQPQNMLLEVLT